LETRSALIVVSGAQGAGKSTVAGMLARRFARGAHVEADALQKMIVSGRQWPSLETTDPQTNAVMGEAGRQLSLRLRNACLLAASFVDAGIVAIVDDIVVGERVTEMMRYLDGRELYFVMLAPDRATIRERELARGTRLFEDWASLYDVIEHRTPRVGLWLDTSHQTPAETVDEIIRRMWVEALVRPSATVAR
jgi:chloramphenicol 3-O-phosphotransferase